MQFSLQNMKQATEHKTALLLQRREQNTSLEQFQPSPLLSNFDSRQYIKLFLLNKQMILVDWFIYRYIFELFFFVSQGQAF